MNVSVSTFYREPHVGAVLQAYAMSRVLKQLGHSAEMVSYDRPPRGGGKRTFKQRIIDVGTGKAATEQQYAAFRKGFLRESAKVYSNIEELHDEPPRAAAYICGSDQIWNPALLANNAFDPAYFLQYGAASVPRLSYAASFGGYTSNSEEQAMLRSFLSEFHALSVREPEAQRMLAHILRRDVACTLDPTLLLNDYSELLDNRRAVEKYVLLYSLQNSEEIRRTARNVSTYLGAKIWSAGGPLLPWKVIGRRTTVRGPIQWINLIHNAEAVVTNSFHGLAFSLLLKKRVIVSPLSGAIRTRNERLFNLCDVLDVRKPVVSTDTSSTFSREIDWERVHQRLAESRASSLQFLRDALTE